MLRFALLLTACSGTPSDTNESDLLREFGFSDAIPLRVQLNQAFNNQGQVTTPTGMLAVVLLNSGFLSVTPNSRSAPWWRFVVTGGSLDGETFQIPVATRVISARSDEQRWSEGAVQLFGETITYSIKLDERIKPSTEAKFEGMKLRLVAFKDPAIGKWQLLRDQTRGTTFSQDDAGLLANTLTAGEPGALLNAIAKAQVLAFDEIQKQLADSGTLEKSAADANVLVSKNNRLMYLRGESHGLSEGVTLGSLGGACAAKDVLHASWRLPSADELQSIFGRTSFFNGTSIIDTPDHRLWGDLSMAAAPGFVIPSSTAPMYVSYGSANHIFNNIAYKLEANGAQFAPQFQKITMMVQGADANSAPLTDGEGGRTQLRLVCVADLAQTSPATKIGASNEKATPIPVGAAVIKSTTPALAAAASSHSSKTKTKLPKVRKRKKDVSSRAVAGQSQGSQQNNPSCAECGVITSITPVKQQGEAGALGAVAGAVVGGVAGNQVGKGNGKTASTLLGALGGALLGHVIEKQVGTTMVYQVAVAMDEGDAEVVTVNSVEGFSVGARVLVEGASIRPTSETMTFRAIVRAK